MVYGRIAQSGNSYNNVDLGATEAGSLTLHETGLFDDVDGCLGASSSHTYVIVQIGAKIDQPRSRDAPTTRLNLWTIYWDMTSFTHSK